MRSEFAAQLALFAGSPEVVVVIDAEGQVLGANPAARARLGAGECVGQLALEAARAPLADLARRVVATGASGTHEWGEDGLDGPRSWFHTLGTPLAGAALLCCRDVTALKQSEVRLRQSEALMVDTQGVAHLGRWDWDVTQPTAVWSAELYRIYGLTPETYTPSYEAYLTMVHPDDRQRVIDATNRVFHEHVPYSHDERVYRPDGSLRYLHTWAIPVLDERGTLRRLVGVCQDITDRKLVEEQLNQLNLELEHRVAARTERLETALRDIETFNAMVSHDLRTPLSVLQVSLELLAHKASEPGASAPVIDRMRRAVRSIRQLVDDLLMLARIDHGPLLEREVALSEVCAEVVAELRETAPDRVVDVHIEPHLRVLADPTLLRAVVRNLVGNAWKYTGHTERPRIEIGTVASSRGRDLFVRDNGIGFDMADYGRLFAPFERLANAAAFDGTGVGLATVRRIVERHRGSLRAEGALGRGATFFVTLPAAAWACEPT